MKLILISYPQNFNGEVEPITQLFQNGLNTFHVRKPDFTVGVVEEYIKQIPQQYHNRVVVHYYPELLDKYKLKGVHFSSSQKVEKLRSDFTYSKSFHSFEELKKSNDTLDYAFISPVFDSISKENYTSNFQNQTELKIQISDFKKTNKKTQLIALGGIDSEKIDICKELGFDGVALLGYIWNLAVNGAIETSLERFKEIKEKCQKNDH